MRDYVKVWIGYTSRGEVFIAASQGEALAWVNANTTEGISSGGVIPGWVGRLHKAFICALLNQIGLPIQYVTLQKGPGRFLNETN